MPKTKLGGVDIIYIINKLCIIPTPPIVFEADTCDWIGEKNSNPPNFCPSLQNWNSTSLL